MTLVRHQQWGQGEGRMRFRYTDGSEDIVSAGEAYYARPGHTFETLENCETVEFSPKEQFDQLMGVVGKNLEAMGQP
jgi:hypothetical protein